MNVETSIPFLEEILAPWQETIGADFLGYKNHVTRMLNFSFYLASPNEEERKKLIISAAFHDIGIWTKGTTDYLVPSVEQAISYLDQNDLSSWNEEISLIIDEHHKIRAVNHTKFPLIELFRRADLVDFSLGFVKNGVEKSFIKQVKKELPNAGFHKRLMQLTWQRFKKHPTSPFPMMKW